jgi:hypothetical protein
MTVLPVWCYYKKQPVSKKDLASKNLVISMMLSQEQTECKMCPVSKNFVSSMMLSQEPTYMYEGPSS